MRSAEEISAMWDQLDNNIREHGWDPTVDGAAQALTWVLDIPPGNNGTMLRRAMERPDAERRAEWIAHGGDPKDWPDAPERPVSSEGQLSPGRYDVPPGTEERFSPDFLDRINQGRPVSSEETNT